MISPPDKIFREGLGQFQKKAPPSAWDRIEKNLDQRKNHVPWIKIAAGLVLVVATSILLWQHNQGARSEHVAVSSEQSAANSQQSAIGSGQSAASSEQSAVGSGQSVASSQQLADNNRESSVVSREGIPSQKGKVSLLQSAVGSLQTVSETDEAHIALMDDPAEEMSELSPVAQIEINNERSGYDVVADYKRTNITYSANEVNAKFLKKEIPTEATPEKKNTSGIQKVIAVALVLYEEPLVGELREKKNEWLSINTSPKKRDINK